MHLNPLLECLPTGECMSCSRSFLLNLFSRVCDRVLHRSTGLATIGAGSSSQVLGYDKDQNRQCETYRREFPSAKLINIEGTVQRAFNDPYRFQACKGEVASMKSV